MNLRLTGEFVTRSPLSHIGESISTTTYLVQEPILQPDGSIEEVFCYSGNAWRGQLRDLAAAYMLDALDARIPLDAFHLLFSGGKIGGDMVIDIERAKAFRKAVPMFALWGGGMQNQILAGKMRVGNCYPVCIEAIRLLPPALRPSATVSYRGMTFEKSFSRKDDAKEPRMAERILAPNAGLLEGPTKRDDSPADQMRMTSELLAPGARLYTRIDLLDVSTVEIGALVSALWAFSRSPHIGGQANKGHGLVELHYDYLDLDTGADGEFLTISDRPRLAPHAEVAKEQYDAHLKDIYDQRLTSDRADIRALLGAA